MRCALLPIVLILFWGAVAAPAGAQPSKQASAKEAFNVPSVFRVETVVAPNTPIEGEANSKLKLSLVNMCFDAKGRLLVSQERGPVLLCLDPDKDGIFRKLVPYCEQVQN